MSYRETSIIVDSIIDAIDVSAPVDAAVKAQFGSDKRLIFFNGINPEKLPAVEFAPYMCFNIPTWKRAVERTETVCKIKMCLVVESNKIDQLNPRVTKMSGPSQIGIVMTEICKAIEDYFDTIDEFVSGGDDVTNDTLTDLFRSEWGYEITSRFE